MHTIAVANRKGGVGKSSVATHLAAAFALEGRRVLVIDMDSQASTSAMLLGPDAEPGPSTAQLLLGEARLTEIVRPSTREGVSVAPAAADLTAAQFAIVARTGRETILRRAMRDLAGYDLAIIDTAPELQLATLNALAAAGHVLMPFTPDPKALEGLRTTAEAVAEIAAAELARPEVLGCVQVVYDRRLAVTDQAREQVRAAYGELLLDTCIRANSSFIVCPAWHRDIFAMEREEKGRKHGSKDFAALATEIGARLGLAAGADRDGAIPTPATAPHAHAA